MTNYREILRLSAMGLSQSDIARSCNASKRTVNSVLKAAAESGRRPADREAIRVTPLSSTSKDMQF